MSTVITMFQISCPILRCSRLRHLQQLAMQVALASTKTSDRKITPRRALMYVPGSDERKLNKVPELEADSIVIDCEDGVASTMKDAARNTASMFVNSGKRPPVGSELGIRVNAPCSGHLELDLKAIGETCSTHLPDAIMLPKVDCVEDLHMFSTLFKNHIVRESASVSPLRLVLCIESALALMNIKDILQAAVRIPMSIPVIPEAVVFGSDDYCASIGASRSKEGSEIVYARQHFVMACKAFGLQAIDAVYIDFKDLVGLEAQCAEGARWGFTGKQVIHPTQVPIVQKAFTPSAEKVEWAHELIAGYEKHVQSGKGAFTFRGQMIDMPLVLQARNILGMF